MCSDADSATLRCIHASDIRCPVNGIAWWPCRELRPHRLVEATAYKNRVFLLALTANGRQWRKSEDKLKTIQQSFDIMA